MSATKNKINAASNANMFQIAGIFGFGIFASFHNPALLTSITC